MVVAAMRRTCPIFVSLTLAAVAGQAHAEELAPVGSPPSTASEQESVGTPSSVAPVDHDRSRAGRIVVESLVGLGAEAGLGITGALVGVAMCPPFSTCGSGGSTAVWTTTVGGTVGAIGGVLVTGSLMHGEGNAWLTVLAGTAGGVGSGLLLNDMNHKTDPAVAPVLAAAMILPVFGSVLGYELSSDSPSTPRERPGGVTCLGFSPQNGGGIVSAVGLF
jgi:hypothetical protein